MSHVIEMLGVALAVPVVLGLVALGLERVEQRLDRPVTPPAPTRRRTAPRPVLTVPSMPRPELPVP